MDYTNIDLSKLTPEQLEPVTDALGITKERARDFLALSRTEHPERDEAWHRKDAIGKFQHFLRKQHGWEGAVDLAWPFIEPRAESVVDAVLSTAEDIPDRPQ